MPLGKAIFLADASGDSGCPAVLRQHRNISLGIIKKEALLMRGARHTSGPDYFPVIWSYRGVIQKC
jgi:hypothetical protein